MAQPSSTRRLAFLKSSAHLLSQQSESTSAHLMTVHNNMLLDQSTRPTARDQIEACPACGVIRIPGVNSRVFTRSQTPMKPARPRGKPRHGVLSKAPSAQRSVVYECMRCKHEVAQHLQQSTRPTPGQRKGLSKAPSAVPLVTSQPSSTPSHVVTGQKGGAAAGPLKAGSENTSSKMRAKSRKQQGLLASLTAEKQRSQLQTKPSKSLDLLDFFQSS
ncbi:hypothetical protein FQN49_002017 [Arthroderma sp. PD_2]|nr:hypothetical protein FQN49_002017 [Arthroderma sp. PD_2]